MQNTSPLSALIDSHTPDLTAMADRIWATPELLYAEFASVAEHVAMLHQKGFRVTEDLAGIPTAVMGEAGEGGPVIAILGEYDALPGLSQVAGIAEPRPVTPGGNGHGCGHNLLGSGAMLAACASRVRCSSSAVRSRTIVSSSRFCASTSSRRWRAPRASSNANSVNRATTA
jgi:aminobenzoyl-glutamate utilization protein B